VGHAQPSKRGIPGVKRPRREGDQRLMRRAILPFLQYVFMARYLVKHRANFTFTLIAQRAETSVLQTKPELMRATRNKCETDRQQNKDICCSTSTGLSSRCDS